MPRSRRRALDRALQRVYIGCMSKPKPLEPLVQVHLMLPPVLVGRMDQVIGAGIAANRSELLRMAVRRYVDAELKRDAAEAERRKGGV